MSLTCEVKDVGRRRCHHCHVQRYTQPEQQKRRPHHRDHSSIRVILISVDLHNPSRCNGARCAQGVLRAARFVFHPPEWPLCTVDGDTAFELATGQTQSHEKGCQCRPISRCSLRPDLGVCRHAACKGASRASCWYLCGGVRPGLGMRVLWFRRERCCSGVAKYINCSSRCRQ